MRDCDYTSTIDFLRKFFAGTDDDVELRVIGNNGGAGKPLIDRDPDKIKVFCQLNDKPGQAVYFGCATRLQGSSQGRRENLSEIVCALIDIDTEKLGLMAEDVIDALKGCPCPPSLIVWSGRGVHAYWLLREALPVTAWTVAEDEGYSNLLRRLAACFAGDPVCNDLPRVMRLPGTHNSKDGGWRLCEVLVANEYRYELSDLAELLDQLGGPLIVLPQAAVESIPLGPPDTVSPGDGETDPYMIAAADMPPELFDLSRLDHMVFKHPGDLAIHAVRVPAIASMIRLGHDADAVFERALASTHGAVMRARGNPAADKVIARWNWRLEEKVIRDEVTSAIRKYGPKFSDGPPLPNPVPAGEVIELRPGQQERPDDDPLPARAPAKKPIVYVKAGYLAQTADIAEKVLRDLEAPFYSRTTKLMRPVIEEDWAADGIKTKVARLAEVSPPFMRDYLSRLAAWFKYDARSEKWVPCDPPKDIAETVLARQGEWLAPPVAVITTQTIRPDGSLLLEEGYDAATRLILSSPPPMPPIPAKPSLDDAVAALALLEELLTEFCFIDEASKAVGLSALMTPVVRGALPVVPAHVMRAPVAGSGKSYLVDLAAAISTGQRCPVISCGKDEMEQEKRLGAALMSGQPIVSIDNLNGELKGDALCQMVERPLVLVRILGKSELMRIETRASLFATGNNILVVGDMVRRTLLSSMDANTERPEERQFKKKPLEMVLADRGKYVAAVITIVRAYQLAGYPGALPPMSSYDSWSLMVRSALGWLGCADPVDTINTSRENDPSLIALNTFVSAWQGAVSIGVKKTAGELIALAGATKKVGDEWVPAHPAMVEALDLVAMGKKGRDATVLGIWLRGQQNKVVGSTKIVADGSKTHARQWSLSTEGRG